MGKLFAAKALMKEPVLEATSKPSLFKKADKKLAPKSGSSMLKRLTGK